jgi:hypothetical protein
MRRHLAATSTFGIVALLGLLSGCGDSSSGTATISDRPAPPVSDFPDPQGRTLAELYTKEGGPDDQIAGAVSGQAFDVGRNRFGFGLFDASGPEITDADVAIYAAHGRRAPAEGPYPARVESLETEPAYRAKTTIDDPDSALAVYVADVPFDKPGQWDVFAMVKRSDGYHNTFVGTVIAGAADRVPDVGDEAPVIHTPTVSEVGDVGQIDTRVPHDNMHDTDLADVLGQKPVVLLFATPALCQSHVCGPVVDVAEQVKSELADSDVAFIHMEIYNDNNPSKGYRPEVKAYGLRTEPWLFVIDRSGRISTRIEGAFGISELEQAVRKVAD